MRRWEHSSSMSIQIYRSIHFTHYVDKILFCKDCSWSLALTQCAHKITLSIKSSFYEDLWRPSVCKYNICMQNGTAWSGEFSMLGQSYISSSMIKEYPCMKSLFICTYVCFKIRTKLRTLLWVNHKKYPLLQEANMVVFLSLWSQ